MYIQTERLVLRPLGLQDLHTTHRYASDIENTRYMWYLPNKTLEETKQFLAKVAAEWERDGQTVYEFAVTLSGRHIGAVSLELYKQGHEAELGWILDKAHWGKDYAAEAALALKEFARTLNVKKLVAHCDSENIPSQKLMEKLGLHLECRDGKREYPDERGVSGEYVYTLTME